MNADRPRPGWGQCALPPAGSVGAADARGSQSLELALILPVVALLGMVVLVAGMVGVELTAAHAAAREAARAAAAGDDVGERLAAVGLADLPAPRVAPPAHAVEPGEPITVEVVAPSRALAMLGARVQLRATATAAREP